MCYAMLMVITDFEWEGRPMAKKANQEPKVEVKLLDIEAIMNNKLPLKEITYEMLLGDAVARKSKEGILYLREQQANIKTRKKKNSEETIEVKQGIGETRANYLKKFTDYETKTNISNKEKTKRNREKEIQEGFDLADLALSMLEE